MTQKVPERAMECALMMDALQGLVPVSFLLGSLVYSTSPVNS